MTDDKDNYIQDGNLVLLELSPFLRHILPFIQTLPEWKDKPLDEILIHLLEQGAMLQNPYFAIGYHDYQKIVPSMPTTLEPLTFRYVGQGFSKPKPKKSKIPKILDK